MAKDVGHLTVEILRQIRGELRGLNGRVDALNGRVDALNGRVDDLTVETRTGFAKMRQEFHLQVAGQRRFTEARLSLIERRLDRLESKR